MRQLSIQVPHGQARSVFYGDHVLLPYLSREFDLIQAMPDRAWFFLCALRRFVSCCRFQHSRHAAPRFFRWGSVQEIPFWEGELDFIKMHGAGNDYVFCDGFAGTVPSNPSELSIRVSDRRLGIGADGLVLIMPPQKAARVSGSHQTPSPDVLMRMWNADGSEGAMCGNAARCVAFWMKRTGRVSNECRIQMGQTLLLADVSRADSGASKSDSVSLMLPSPEYSGAAILPDMRDAGRFSSLLAGCFEQNQLICHTVDCGNQHAVIFVDSLADDLVRTLGPAVEKHAAFPNRINVEFVCVQDRRTLEVRVWERGSGETLACGSGACAASVAAISEGKCDSGVPINVCLPGGTLTVTWPGPAGARDISSSETAIMLLTGPVSLEFIGTWVGQIR